MLFVRSLPPFHRSIHAPTTRSPSHRFSSSLRKPRPVLIPFPQKPNQPFHSSIDHTFPYNTPIIPSFPSIYDNNQIISIISVTKSFHKQQQQSNHIEYFALSVHNKYRSIISTPNGRVRCRLVWFVSHQSDDVASPTLRGWFPLVHPPPWKVLPIPFLNFAYKNLNFPCLSPHIARPQNCLRSPLVSSWSWPSLQIDFFLDLTAARTTPWASPPGVWGTMRPGCASEIPNGHSRSPLDVDLSLLLFSAAEKVVACDRASGYSEVGGGRIVTMGKEVGGWIPRWRQGHGWVVARAASSTWSDLQSQGNAIDPCFSELLLNYENHVCLCLGADVCVSLRLSRPPARHQHPVNVLSGMLQSKGWAGAMDASKQGCADGNACEGSQPYPHPNFWLKNYRLDYMTCISCLPL